MRNPIPILAMLLLLWIGGSAWFYYNSACCGVAAVESYSSPFRIQDGASTVANHPQNFVFGLSNMVPIIPAEVEATFGKVATYLRENPNKSLTLTGRYRQDETNTTNFENLGLGRADAIKQYLLGLGLSESQLILDSQLDNDLVDRNDQVYGGISYAFKTEEVAEAPAPPAQLTAGPLTVYFSKDKQSLLLDEEQKTYFDNLIKYLGQNPGVLVDVEGHTDADGDAQLNNRLGRKRAEFVRDYMVDLGINTKQIKISFKGQNEPIATNETREGKAKNRRVEVSLLK